MSRPNDSRPGQHWCLCEHASHSGRPCPNEANWHYWGNSRVIRHERCRSCEQEHRR